MDYNDKIFLRIANTLILNLSNSPLTSLNGGLGTIIFLFRHADLTKNNIYRLQAEDLLKQAVRRFEKEISNGNTEHAQEVAFALLYLISSGYLSDSDNSNEIRKFDQLILTNVNKFIYNHTKKHFLPTFYPGLYLLYRVKKYPVNFGDYTESFCEQMKTIISGMQQTLINPGWDKMCCSMLHVCTHLKYVAGISSNKIDELINLLLEGIQYEKKTLQKDIITSMILMNSLKLIETNNKKFSPISQSLAIELTGNNHTAGLQLIYDNCCQLIVHEIKPEITISEEEIKTFINAKIIDAYYNQMDISAKLSSFAIMLTETI